MILNPSFEEPDLNGKDVKISGVPREISGSRMVVQQATNDFKIKHESRMVFATIVGLGGGITVKQTTQDLTRQRSTTSRILAGSSSGRL
ncbi:hypothetical protein CEP53_014156 [Fusarium sp. AF-6]|nr:hypothetical protein CEP53_014156 [Fusarium sp. AF-6]